MVWMKRESRGGVRTELGSAAKVDEGPVVLDRPAEDVAGLDVAVSVAEAVQVRESPDRMVQRLHHFTLTPTRSSLPTV